jgi:HrpA-like RNA helicase
MKDPRRIAPIPTGAPSASGDRATGGAHLGARASSHVARHDEKVGPDAEKNADVANAAAARRARKLVLQRVRASLPIAFSRERLVAEIRARETLIVVGETGSGKTTQLPQYAHEAGLAGGLAVACTQPRRVAAVSVARRVAEETGTALGDLVGYAIRFEDVSSAATRVKFLTDGMLLREATADANLERYGVVMIDEAHERTLQTDFLLGVLKQTQERRRVSGARPLKLVIMSATLEADSFSKFFGNAPVVYSRGRKFPVETFYTEEPEDDYLDAALCAVCQINESEPEGDVLVFLTGQEEIESLGRLLRARAGARAPENAVNEEGEKETTKKARVVARPGVARRAALRGDAPRGADARVRAGAAGGAEGGAGDEHRGDLADDQRHPLRRGHGPGQAARVPPAQRRGRAGGGAHRGEPSRAARRPRRPRGPGEVFPAVLRGCDA